MRDFSKLDMVVYGHNLNGIYNVSLKVSSVSGVVYGHNLKGIYNT